MRHNCDCTLFLIISALAVLRGSLEHPSLGEAVSRYQGDSGSATKKCEWSRPAQIPKEEKKKSHKNFENSDKI